MHRKTENRMKYGLDGCAYWQTLRQRIIFASDNVWCQFGRLRREIRVKSKSNASKKGCTYISLIFFFFLLFLVLILVKRLCFKSFRFNWEIFLSSQLTDLEYRKCIFLHAIFFISFIFPNSAGVKKQQKHGNPLIMILKADCKRERGGELKLWAKIFVSAGKHFVKGLKVFKSIGLCFDQSCEKGSIASKPSIKRIAYNSTYSYQERTTSWNG